MKRAPNNDNGKMHRHLTIHEVMAFDRGECRHKHEAWMNHMTDCARCYARFRRIREERPSILEDVLAMFMPAGWDDAE